MVFLLIEFTDEFGARYANKRSSNTGGKDPDHPGIAYSCGNNPWFVATWRLDLILIVALFQHFNPNIFFGGDSVVFWGPLSWTIIFGLSFRFSLH